MVSNLFLVVLCVLPWSAFIFRKMDIWHGMGMWFQVGILVLFLASFFEKPKRSQMINKPLVSLTAWLGLITCTYWYFIMAETKNYPVKLFFPFFNWLCFVWFYKLSVEYLDKDGIERILKWLSYSVLGVVLYSVLQVFGLDQFYTGFLGKDELVGTIGNPSHLAGYLALCSPLFFEKKRQNILTLILIWLVILMTKSASGVIVGLAISLFWMFYKRYFKGLIVTIIMVTFGLILIHRQIPYFLTFSHRLEIWGLIWEKAKLRVITGSGLGMMNIWKMTTASDPNSVWRHAHLEYLQVIVESGLIGLILIGWCIKDYFSRFRYCYSELALKLKSIFFGFCLLSLFSFPAHLWLLSSLCMISYSFMYALEGSDGDNQL